MSTIKTNTLTGTTSAGSIVVTGEGGVYHNELTTRITKAWINYKGTSTNAIEIVLNYSGVVR